MADSNSLFIPVTEPALNGPVVIERRISWSDTDAAGRWHYSTAFSLFESAEVELFSRLGMAPEIISRLPRVHAQADFKSVLVFFDPVRVAVGVDGIGRTSITFGFSVTKGSEKAVNGRIVCAHVDEQGTASPLPTQFAGRLQTYKKICEEQNSREQ